MVKITEEGIISNEKIPKISAYLLPAHSVNLREIIKKENILGVIKYSDKEKNDEFEMPGGLPKINVQMKSFLDCDYYEVWTSDNAVNYGSYESLQYATDGFHHFLAANMEEKGRDLREIGRLAYELIFELLRRNNYPNISRVWNNIPNINKYTDETERYIKFCHGRAESFQKYGNIISPAATGIGCFGDSVSIYMISVSKDINTCIENPNQTPAYKYPPKYGIKSPLFARATYTDNGSGRGVLYISGTASIIGSETVHIGDVGKQCETAIDNIRVLISGTNLNSYGIKKGFTLENLDCIKVYIKNDGDFETVRDICSKAFTPDKSIAYLKADICRNDLLVELEGVVMDSSE